MTHRDDGARHRRCPAVRGTVRPPPSTAKTKSRSPSRSGNLTCFPGRRRASNRAATSWPWYSFNSSEHLGQEQGRAFGRGRNSLVES